MKSGQGSQGNLRIWDARHSVNIPALRQDFTHLCLDRYVKEGFRRKHITRFINKPHGLMTDKDPERTRLFQSTKYNPVHGNIDRLYPEYLPGPDAMRVINMFKEITDPPIDKRITVQAQRITCTSCEPGYPSVEDWHCDGATYIAVMCVDRKNIIGGFSEFRNADTKEVFFSEILEPGHFATFQDHDIEHRVTLIASKDMVNVCHRDVLLMSW